MANSIKDLVGSVDWRKMLSSADTRNALEELIGNKVWPRRRHNGGKEPVLAAKGCHRTHGHRRQCLEQTAAQLVEMSPEIHFNLRIEN